MRRIFSFLGRHAWIFVVLAFTVIIGVWVTFFMLAGDVPQNRLVPKRTPARSNS